MHKSKSVDPALSGVAETLLIPLYYRVIKSERPDAMMTDQRAVEIVAQMSYDFDQVRKIRMHEANKAARIMLTREIDPPRPGFPRPSPRVFMPQVNTDVFNVRQPK